MKHSEILSIVEESISSDNIDIINVTDISTHEVDKDDYEVFPGKMLKAGTYAVVAVRFILPIK
jgi:hypothetical protein